MVKRKFKGRRLGTSELSFYVDGDHRDMFTGNETALAPYLNNKLNMCMQQHILSFLGNMKINTAYYEDCLLEDEKKYCENKYDDDFVIDIIYEEKKDVDKYDGWYPDEDISIMMYC